jgi:heme/copper-type cytochrome/quinol oxidase subunit 2
MGIYEIVLVIHLLVWIIALVSIIRARPRKGIYMVLWLLAIFLLPVVGVVTYFLFGRRCRAGDDRDTSGGNESIPFENQHFPPGNSDDFSNINH